VVAGYLNPPKNSHIVGDFRVSDETGRLSLDEARLAGALCVLRQLLEEADAAVCKSTPVTVDPLLTVISGLAAALHCERTGRNPG
jgi:hypothetical protein